MPENYTSKDIHIEDFDTPPKNILVERIKYEEKRKDQHERVKHFLAGIIIIPYIFLLVIGCFWGFEIPKSYETLALIIIGYYFASYIGK